MVDTRFHAYSGVQSLHALLDAVGQQDLIEGQDLPDLPVAGADELEVAGKSDIAVAANRKYLDALKATKAGLVLVTADLAADAPDGIVAIIADDPRGVFVDILDCLYPQSSRHLIQQTNAGGTDNSGIEDNVEVGPGTIIGAGAEIGAGTTIGPNCYIGAGVTIGRDCIIAANVSIECTYMGNDVFVQPGARIGVEGFGWLDHGRSNRKVAQLGRVIVQDNVQIGANSIIDRGALGDTVIGEGTKIDNLVQIGHNSKLGRNCLIAATSGLSGSTILGDSVLVGGGVGTAGHLTIGSGSIVNGRAAVTKDWPEGSKLAGAPAQDVRDFWRELAVLRRLTKGDKK